MPTHRTLRLALVQTTVLTLASLSHAQDQAAGFALNNFDPSERGSEWFAADSLDLRGNGRPAIGIVGDYAYKPLVIYSAQDGEEIGTVVKDQLFVHVGGSFVFADRVRLGVNLPVLLLQTSGDGVVAGGQSFSSKEGVTVGDLRLSGDIRLAGAYGDVFQLAGGVAVYAPTGSRDAFTSDGTVRAVPRLLFAGDAGGLVYSGKLGFHIRPQDDNYAGATRGHEMTFAAAVGARIEKNLVLGPEVFGSTVVRDGAAFSKEATPFEVIAGAHYRVSENIRVGAGVGPGLTRGFGAPKVRGLLSLEYHPDIVEKKPTPPPQPGDRDGDGIFDKDDACPDEPGVRTDDPKTNGCPPLKDRDRDGIFDQDDACPDVPGVRTDDPKTNGCPPPSDRDRDGIIDTEDACPDEPGVRTDDPKTNGCPPPKDRDADGIFDPEDACPDAPGPRSDDPKKNGCPLARIEKAEIKIIEQVKFAYNSDKILPESEPILNAVLRILTDHPEIKRLDIHGHTDSQGPDAYNLNLSKRRAASVMKWLKTHGIAEARLSSQGFGETKPIDSNDTEEGRRNNRRSEFHILKEGESPVVAPPPPGGAKPPAKGAPKAGAPKPAPEPKAAEPKPPAAPKAPAPKPAPAPAPAPKPAP